MKALSFPIPSKDPQSAIRNPQFAIRNSQYAIRNSQSAIRNTPYLNIMINSHRPLYHFTPPYNWMNDPNGLVYYDGEYHLFYQHHPYSMKWGPMHWGHAISRDLVRWEHMPIALYPDELGMIFSGSAVIDWHNTAGFGAEAMVAIFTYHLRHGYESQGIAYSLDRGRTWNKYAGNPVILPPEGEPDFRDPKVFWYERGQYWVMVIVVGEKVAFYTSPNLKDWTKTSEFGMGYGAHGGVWEVPDLFELPIDEGSATKWVLSVSMVGNGLRYGRGVQYFIGDFDGQTFTCDDAPERIRWVDYGADFYANISWHDLPDERRIWVGWMSNWSYAHDLPTPTWQGALTLPREVSLRSTPTGIQLIQQPIREIQSLRNRAWTIEQGLTENKGLEQGLTENKGLEQGLTENKGLEQGFIENKGFTAARNLLEGIRGETLEIIAEFEVPARPLAPSPLRPLAEGGREFGLRVRTGGKEQTTVGYNIESQSIFVDRTHSGKSDFYADFAERHSAKMEPFEGKVRLHLFIDRSSLELFANDGLVSMTACIFPSAESVGLELFAEGGTVLLTSLEIYELRG